MSTFQRHYRGFMLKKSSAPKSKVVTKPSPEHAGLLDRSRFPVEPLWLVRGPLGKKYLEAPTWYLARERYGCSPLDCDAERLPEVFESDGVIMFKRLGDHEWDLAIVTEGGTLISERTIPPWEQPFAPRLGRS